jgi:hypothetical protein
MKQGLGQRKLAGKRLWAGRLAAAECAMRALWVPALPFTCGAQGCAQCNARLAPRRQHLDSIIIKLAA